jgi:hypothetical protein
VQDGDAMRCDAGKKDLIDSSSVQAWKGRLVPQPPYD